MRNLSFFLIALAAAWWYLGGSNTEAVVLPDGTLNYPDYRIETVETFAIDARVLSREDYHSDREAELSPTDLALGWGPMAEDEVRAAFEISQRNRWYYWKAERMPIARAQVAAYSANMHMIPANELASAALARVRVDDRVRLKGRLVDVNASDGWRWRTSRSRSDSGKGACELLLLEHIEWL